MDACVSVCARVCVHTCAWVGWQWTLCHRILMMIIISLERDCPLNFARIQGPPCCCGVVLIRDSIIRVRDQRPRPNRIWVRDRVYMCVCECDSVHEYIEIQDQIAFGFGIKS